MDGVHVATHMGGATYVAPRARAGARERHRLGTFGDPMSWRAARAGTLTMTRTPTQTVVLLKSILLFSHTHVHVAIVADSHRTFELAIEASTYGWSADACARFSFSRHRLYYPPGTEFMRHLNRPCSSSRHFFPEYFAGTRYMLNLTHSA